MGSKRDTRSFGKVVFKMLNMEQRNQMRELFEELRKKVIHIHVQAKDYISRQLHFSLTTAAKIIQTVKVHGTVNMPGCGRKSKCNPRLI